MKEVDMTNGLEKVWQPQIVYRLDGTVSNLLGVGEIRWFDKEKLISAKEESVETDGGVDASSKVRSQKGKEWVFTFPQPNGQIVAPLGKYTKGALKEVASWFTMKPDRKHGWLYGYKKHFEDMVVLPELTQLGKSFDNDVNHPFQTFVPMRATTGEKKGVWHYYDSITERPITLYLLPRFDIPAEVITPMLQWLERVGLGPKSNGKLKISSFKKIIVEKGDSIEDVLSSKVDEAAS